MINKPTMLPLDPGPSATLRRLTQHKALYLVARDLRMNPGVVTRALAGLPMHQASRVLLEIRLNELTTSNFAGVEAAA